jgi:hypothetical protein
MVSAFGVCIHYYVGQAADERRNAKMCSRNVARFGDAFAGCVSGVANGFARCVLVGFAF